jgi:hypothetical protein
LQHQTIITITPTIPTKGIKLINCHQPDLLISCKRLAVAAIVGIKSTTSAIIIRGKYCAKCQGLKLPSIIKEVTIARIDIKKITHKLNRIKYQNSDLDALPIKVPYFLKQTLADFTNLFLSRKNAQKQKVTKQIVESSGTNFSIVELIFFSSFRQNQHCKPSKPERCIERVFSYY